MTTKELLALVGKWRDNAKRWREESKAMTGDYERQCHWATAAEHAGACADELAPIATALCAEVEALRKDAERYRWLRDNKDKITMTSAFNRVHGYGKFSVDAGTFDTLDAAIDAARSRNEHEG